MRILIIGGTRFVGRHIAAAAIERGHAVTLFHRGITNPHLFGDAEHVHGDRHAGGLAALGDRGFDAVVDPTAYFPADVEAASAIAAGRYVLISSVSVYRDPVAPGSDEAAPTHQLDGESGWTRDPRLPRVDRLHRGPIGGSSWSASPTGRPPRRF